MADYTSDRTGASIDTVLDNADNSRVNLQSAPRLTTGDLNDQYVNKTLAVGIGASNAPINNGVLHSFAWDASSAVGQLYMAMDSDAVFVRSKGSNSWQRPWQELYHTGNMGNLRITDQSSIGIDTVSVSLTQGRINLGNAGTGAASNIGFYNNNGQVGLIFTNGTSTSYGTSSDPRLKDFKAAPTDAEVNAKFDDLFGCFKTFNWKSDVDGELVWGFDAHATIDAGLDMGTEGEGSRDLALGDVYDTTPAELDEDGVEIKAAIEHKVSPAGVDQSKAVPILLAKIEQLERRLAALEV